MPFAQDLKDGLADAFDNDLSDAVAQFKYQSPKTGRIDPHTGTRTNTHLPATGRCIPEEMSHRSVKNIEFGQVGDIEITFIIDEVKDEEGNVVPVQNDGKITMRGKTYTVINQPSADPSQTVCTALIRG